MQSNPQEELANFRYIKVEFVKKISDFLGLHARTQQRNLAIFQIFWNMAIRKPNKYIF